MAALNAAPTSLKPAALPLMDSGKALARSGEFLIDLTTALDLYGGALSASGAQIRNAGDCLAQAAASMRFKTGAELVVDELREAATCLKEAVVKLKLAVEEAEVDDDPVLAEKIGAFSSCGDVSLLVISSQVFVFSHNSSLKCSPNGGTSRRL